MSVRVSVNSDMGRHGLPLKNAPWQKKQMWYDVGEGATVLSKHDANFRGSSEPIMAYPQVSVNSIDTIDGQRQVFSARYTLFVNFSITEQEYDAYEADPTNWKPEFVPYFMPYNAVSVDTDNVVRNPDGSNYIVTVQQGRWCAGQFREQRATFATRFDLHAFPFDVQTLPILFEIRDFQFSWNKPRPQVLVSAEAYWEAGAECAGFQDYWVPPIAGYQIEREWIAGSSFLPSKNSWGPVFKVTIKAKRFSSYFVTRVGVVVSAISFVATYMFLIQDPIEVISYMAALLIAIEAFRLTVASYIPVVNYWTVLDKAMYGSFFFTLLCGSINFAALIAPELFTWYNHVTAWYISLVVLGLAALSVLVMWGVQNKRSTQKIRKEIREAKGCKQV